ncbi:uncharacterized protein LOC143258169 [Tachypleus tridentatus]|uniref:uncharacterized protein LOC143258169 n=1 Tax=Tachypleus tridentatus TaxID=6853 RepID=UPI003FCFDABD
MKTSTILVAALASCLLLTFSIHQTEGLGHKLKKLLPLLLLGGGGSKVFLPLPLPIPIPFPYEKTHIKSYPVPVPFPVHVPNYIPVYIKEHQHHSYGSYSHGW